MHSDDVTRHIERYVPVCASFTHVAFATYRLESQYAVFGHASGTAAALALKTSKAAPSVQNVNVTNLREVLLEQHQLLSSNSSNPPSPSPSPSPSPPHSKTWACAAALKRCVGTDGAGGGHVTFPNSTCSGTCTPLGAHEWLAHDCCGIWSHNSSSTTIVALKTTYLKKSTVDSSLLPDDEKHLVNAGHVCTLVPSVARAQFDEYLLCTIK